MVFGRVDSALLNLFFNRLPKREHDAVTQKQAVENLKNKHRMLPLAMLLVILALLPSLPPAHAGAEFITSANPLNIVVEAGIPVNVTITVTSTGGFTGTVTFSAFAGSGFTTSFNQTSVTLLSGRQATSTLSITADSSCPGPHNATAKGTSGWSLSHSHGNYAHSSGL